MLDKIFGEGSKSPLVYSGIKSFWKFLSRHTLLIEYKYYCEQFGIEFDIVDDSAPCSAIQLLLSVLNLEWIHYIPFNHPEVQGFVENITKPWMVVSKVFKQAIKKNAEDILEQSVFQGSTIVINIACMKFSEFAGSTIEKYVSMSVDESSTIDKIVSELELVAIGLLGIVSLLEEHSTIILPQSYQIVLDLFNDFNGCNLLYLLTLDQEAVWHILQSLIMILLGNSDDSDDGLLAKAFTIQNSKKNHMKEFGFERYFVLILTLLGNLAPFLDLHIKSLFAKISSKLAKNSGDSFADKKSLASKVICVSNVVEVFKIIDEIQAKYSRGMVTYDFVNFNFKLVHPTDFPQSEIYSTKQCEIHFKYIAPKDQNFQETNPSEQGEKLASFLEEEENFPPLETSLQVQDALAHKQNITWNKATGQKITKKLETPSQYKEMSSLKQETSLQKQEEAKQTSL